MARTRETPRRNPVTKVPSATPQHQELKTPPPEPVTTQNQQHEHCEECEIDTNIHVERAKKVLGLRKAQITRILYGKNEDKFVQHDSAWEVDGIDTPHVWTFEKVEFSCKCQKILVKFHQTDSAKYSIMYNHCGHGEGPVKKKAKIHE